jgi:hypothetical protein
MTTPATPVLSNFFIAPKVYGMTPFELTPPTSTNTDSNAPFTFSSSDNSIATISERRVTILRAGNVVITATQMASLPNFTSASITTTLSIALATPTITNFTISPKSFDDVSFSLTPPLSDSSGQFLYRSLTTDTVMVSGMSVSIKRPGLARIEVNQQPVPNYYTQASSIAEFDILSSIVRIGVQNQIDLSWNIPIENGATIKNYFIYKEERSTTQTPAPSVSTMVYGNANIRAVEATNACYYSYALPVSYLAQILSASTSPSPTGIDINSSGTDFIIATSSTFNEKNYIDLGYYCEIEISWNYHNDSPILELTPSTVSSTTMTLNIYKEGPSGRVDLLINAQRNYDSFVNGLGPRPQNNNKTLTDIFTVSFDASTNRELKYLRYTDVISGKVKISNNTYLSAINGEKTYSIILKTIRIAPYRLAIARDFTTEGFGGGNADTGVGFAISTVNAAAPLASSGILYHMPKMTRSMVDFNEATWKFSWTYGANLARLAMDISYLPINVSGGETLSANLNIPFQMRLRAYSRPYAKTLSAISVEQYNTTNVAQFLTNVGDSRYHTRLMMDVSWNDTATYSEILSGNINSIALVKSRTFDVSGVYGYPEFSSSFDTSHTQFVFLFQLVITDPSYNAYFQRIATSSSATTDAFRVKMLSHSLTPKQEYQFLSPDPTLSSSNALTSDTNTIYSIRDPYTNIRPFYRFYNLVNGVFYSFRIASNNRAGTSSFSELITRRCGSVPNTIVNTVVNGKNTLELESEITSNQVNLFWTKPSFSGYEIQYFVIQLDLDVSGQWMNFLDYTPDVSHNTLLFNRYQDINVPATYTDPNNPLIPFEAIQYSYKINTYKNKNENVSLPLNNGSKYYVRIASVNQVGISAYSSILSGVVFARPPNAPVTIIGSPVVGNQLIYLTWKIPQDDAGSPILNYIIDYEKETPRVINGITTYRFEDKRRYLIRADEPTRLSYPKDDFKEVYASYKKYNLLTEDEKTRINILRTEITRFIIPPNPITLRDSDYYGSRRDPISGLLLPPIPNRNVILSYTQSTFTYIGTELTQNVFDISNVQIKWYYTYDPTGSETWDTDNTTVSFRMSMRGYLLDMSENIAVNLFSIPATTLYNVNRTIFSSGTTFYYINYETGAVIPISNGGSIPDVPKIFVPSLPRIDSYNQRRYKPRIDFEITEFVPNTGLKRFIVYVAPIVINGTSPVRTSSGMNTIFTLKLENKPSTPIFNDIKYRFTITPFNMNDYFTPTSLEERIGTTIGDPISNASYSLISTSAGGIVTLQWNYTAISDYFINISIPDQYQNGTEEYPLVPDANSFRSIFVKTLTPVNGVVSYQIPSNLSIDVTTGNAQTYLKSGRGYNISISPVKIVEVANEVVSLAAESRNVFPDGTHIVPFRTPSRPVGLTALANNGFVALSWRLPNLLNDPNYYITTYAADPPLPFYRYRFYSLERRDISAALVANRNWVVVADEILIPDGGVSAAGSVINYTVSGLINENNHQFRVRLMIINNYNGLRTFSDYTYLSNINTIPVSESSGNVVYPSIYPYKPSRPVLRFASRGGSELKTLFVSFDYPSYNGNADYYDVEIEYTPPVGVSGSNVNWYNIFNTTPGIGIAPAPSVPLRTTNAVQSGGSQMYTIPCYAIVIAYGIRVRLLPRKNGIPPLYTFYTDYSDVDFIDI